MKLSNPYSNYKDTQIKTASPVMLIILLYEGALKAILKGKTLIQDEAQLTEAAKELLKAMNIVMELQGIINPEQSPDIAEGLSESYKSVLLLINEVLQDKDPAHLTKAAEIMNSLLSAWREASEKVVQQAG